jgi:hypothetical protein
MHITELQPVCVNMCCMALTFVCLFPTKYCDVHAVGQQSTVRRLFTSRCRKDNWGATWEEIVAAPVKKTEANDGGDPLRWPRNTLYPQKLALLRQQAAVAQSA